MNPTHEKLIHGYHACVAYVDALIGRLLGELDRLGLRERTVVALFGDHGWKLGDYGAWGKDTAFEIDANAPLLIRNPGSGAGRVTRALVEHVDLYPTLAELCGLGIPAHCEGTSMVPLLNNPNRRWKEAAFTQCRRRGATGYSLRTETQRYTEWIRKDTGETVARELYDHAASRIATKNLAGRAEHADALQRLSALLDGGRGWKRVREGI